MLKNKLVLSKAYVWQKLCFLICGVFLFAISLEIGLRLAGRIFLSVQEYRNSVSLKQKSICRIMCIGESTTFWGGRTSYPSQLEEILNSSGLGKNFSVINKGVPGGNTIAIVANLEDNLDKYKPDIIVAMMGINDTENYVFFEDSVSSGSGFFLKNLRIYKLIKLLCFHISAKTNSARSLKERVNKKMSSGDFNWDEKQSMKSFKLNPQYSDDYTQLGKIYRGKEDYLEAENAFKKAIDSDQRNENAYYALGWFYNDIGNYLKAEEIFNKAIGINPENDWPYVEMGEFYRVRLNYVKSEELFKKAITLNSANEWAYIRLGLLYIDQNKYAQAGEWFSQAIVQAVEKEGEDKGLFFRQTTKKPIECNSQRGRLYAEIAMLNGEIGNHEIAMQYYKKSEELRLKCYNPVTLQNYRELKKISDKRMIKLICVQYPMRSVEPLKKIFEGLEGVIFVDNENTFKSALRKSSYREYFTDIFGGDFGHCTEKGNRLLAENIAQVVLKKCFKK